MRCTAKTKLGHQCARRAEFDGWCTQHHPDWDEACRKFHQEERASKAKLEIHDELVETLKMVLQHGRIDDSESCMNQVTAVLAKAREIG